VFIRDIRGYFPYQRLSAKICGDVLWLIAAG
jgi:hypothetical protein